MIKIMLFACLQIYPGKRRVDLEFTVSPFIPSIQRKEGEATYAYAVLTFPAPALPALPKSSNLSASTAAAPSEKRTSPASNHLNRRQRSWRLVDNFCDSLATDNNILDRHKFAENQTAMVAFKGQRREVTLDIGHFVAP